LPPILAFATARAESDAAPKNKVLSLVNQNDCCVPFTVKGSAIQRFWPGSFVGGAHSSSAVGAVWPNEFIRSRKPIVGHCAG